MRVSRSRLMFHEGEAISKGSTAKEISFWKTCACVCVFVCITSFRDTFSLSSRLIARASCSCSSSSPLDAGMACSRSGSRWDEVEATTEAIKQYSREIRHFKRNGECAVLGRIYEFKKKGKGKINQILSSGKSKLCCCMLIFHCFLFRALAGMARCSLPGSACTENNDAAV